MGRIRYTVTRIIKRKMLHIVTTKYFVLAVEKPFSCDLRVFSEISKLPTMFFFNHNHTNESYHQSQNNSQQHLFVL